MGIEYPHLDNLNPTYEWTTASIDVEGEHHVINSYVRRVFENTQITLTIDVCDYIDVYVNWIDQNNEEYEITSMNIANRREISARFIRQPDSYALFYNSPANNNYNSTCSIAYQLSGSDDHYNYYRLYLDGVYLSYYLNPGGYPDGSLYEAKHLIGVPKSEDNYKTAYFNSYIASTSTWEFDNDLHSFIRTPFSAKCGSAHFDAKIVVSSNDYSGWYSRHWYDNRNKNLSGAVVGVSINPEFAFLSNNEIVQPYKKTETWNIKVVDNGYNWSAYKPISGCLTLPSLNVPGTINEHGEKRNYYKIEDCESGYPWRGKFYDLPTYLSGTFENMYSTVLFKNKHGYSSTGGFVQMLLADGFPDDKVHWQLRYIDSDGITMKWFASEESFTPVSGFIDPINPISAHWYGLNNCTLGIATVSWS